MGVSDAPAPSLGLPGCCGFRGMASYSGRVLDTLAGAQELTAGGVERNQAEAIAGAIGHAVEHGDHVTSDQIKAGLTEVRAEIAEIRTEMASSRRDSSAGRSGASSQRQR